MYDVMIIDDEIDVREHLISVIAEKRIRIPCSLPFAVNAWTDTIISGR